MDCGHEMQLRLDTVMQGNYLFVRDWFACMFLMTATNASQGGMEVDEGFFSTETLEDFKASTLICKISQGTDGNATVTTDGCSSYASMVKDGAAASPSDSRRG